MKEQIIELIKNNSPEEATEKILKLVVKADVMRSAFDAGRQQIECKALYDSNFQDSEGGCTCKDGCSEMQYENFDTWWGENQKHFA